MDLSSYYHFAPVGYFTLDPEGTICEANLTFATLLNLERSQLVKRRLGVFVSPSDLAAFNAFLTRVFAGRTREYCEVSLLRDEKPPVAVRIEAAAAGSGRECRATVTDMPERLRAEADRLILGKLESTGLLAGGIAHDFNNLLTVILLNLEVARTGAPDGGELAESLEEAKKTTLLARGLTQRLITLAPGGGPVVSETELSGLIRESVRLALGGSRVRGEFALAPELWTADVDAGQLGQALGNVVQNAREAMPQGGVITIRADNFVLGGELPLLPPGKYVGVSISDQGGGIPKEVLPRIFDPYFSTKQRGVVKGMGLGLTLCHSIVEKHGGAITVESADGVGTTVHIYLPASRKATAPAKTVAPEPLSRPGRILLMEDEDEVRKILGTALRRMGHEVELTADGEAAVDVYRRSKELGRPFDAVILDLTVRAGMGGLEAMEALLRMDPAVKAIVMSGYANDPVILEHERHGFKGALTKPFNMDRLRDLVAQVIENQSKCKTTP